MSSSAIAKHRPIDQRRLLYSTHMVTIEVGPEKQKFVVHQDLLCQRSQYFAKAFCGSFLESHTRVVQLDDVSPVVVRIFIAWLYHGKLSYTTPDDNTTIEKDFETLEIDPNDVEDDDKSVSSDTHSDPPTLDGDDPGTWDFDTLCKLYVFGDRFDTREFRATVIDAMSSRIGGTTEMPCRYHIRYIYENTPADSPLRNFLVQMVSFRWAFRETASHWKNMPVEFLAGVMVAMGRKMPCSLCEECRYSGLHENKACRCEDEVCKKKDVPQYIEDICFYHEHIDEEERKACRTRRGDAAEEEADDE